MKALRLLLSALVLAAPASALVRPPTLVAIERHDTHFSFPSGAVWTDRSLVFVQRDGTVTEAVVADPVDGGEATSGFVFRGPLPPAPMAELRQALGAARPGRQRDCRAAVAALANESRFTWRVTWFGRGERRNAFLVTTEDASLPSCPAEVEALLAAVARLLFQLPRQEGTELLSATP